MDAWDGTEGSLRALYSSAETLCAVGLGPFSLVTRTGVRSKQIPGIAPELLLSVKRSGECRGCLQTSDSWQV